MHVLTAETTSEQCREITSMLSSLDRQDALRAVQASWKALEFTSDESRDDPEVLLAALQQDPQSIRFASDRMRADLEVALQAVALSGMTLKFLSADLRDAHEIVLAAVRQDPRSLQFASDGMKADREVALQAVRIFGLYLEFVSPELRDDSMIVRAAVEQDLRASEFASRERLCDLLWFDFDEASDITNRLRADRSCLLRCVQLCGMSLEVATDDLKDDHEIVLAAVEQDPQSIRFASDRMRADRAMILRVVQLYGLGLEFASNDLKDDLEIILAAFKKDPQAIKFASGKGICEFLRHAAGEVDETTSRIRADRNLVLQCVQLSGQSLEFASSDLKDDREIVLAAVKQDTSSIRFASDIQIANPEVLLAAAGGAADAGLDASCIAGASAGNGNAFVPAMVDERSISEVRWYTVRLKGAPGRLGVRHSFLAISYQVPHALYLKLSKYHADKSGRYAPMVGQVSNGFPVYKRMVYG